MSNDIRNRNRSFSGFQGSLFKKEYPKQPRNSIFTDQDYYRLFPNGIPKKTYQPRQLYPYEIRALKVILRNPLLEDALRNDFGKRTLNKTEINTLKVIFRTHSDRTSSIEKIFEETLKPFETKVPKQEVEVQLITETEKKPSFTFQELQKQRYKATQAVHHRQYKNKEQRSIFTKTNKVRSSSLQDKRYRGPYYHTWCADANRSGDIDPDQYWFYSQANEVDKVRSLNSTYELYNYIDTTQYDSFHYQLDKSGYQAIVTHLTPDATEREYGRVFFSTETRYTPLYFSSYRYQPQDVRGYSIRQNRKIFGPKYVKPYKGVIFHDSQDGSILKKRTEQGLKIQRFLRYFDTITKHNEEVPAKHLIFNPFRIQIHPDSWYLRPPKGPTCRGHIALTLYFDILKQNSEHDYIEWINTKADCPYYRYSYPFYPPENKWCYEHPNRSYETSRERNKHIDSVLQHTFRCRLQIKKIQRKFRERKQIKHKRYIEKLRNLGKLTSTTTLTTTGEPSGPGKV